MGDNTWRRSVAERFREASGRLRATSTVLERAADRFEGTGDKEAASEALQQMAIKAWETGYMMRKIRKELQPPIVIFDKVSLMLRRVLLCATLPER